jgi:hypothetical protein
MEREGIITKVKVKMDEVTPPGVELPFDDLIGPILDECSREVAEIAPLHLLSPISMVNGSVSRKVDTNVATIGLGVHPYLVGDIVSISGFVADVTYNGDYTITAITESSISYALTHIDETETADTAGTVTYKTIFTNDKAYIAKPLDFLRLYEMKFPLWQKPVRETTKPGTIEGNIQDNPYLASGIGRPSVIIQTNYPTGGTLRDYLICGKVETSTIPSVALYVKNPLPEALPDLLIDSLTWLAAAKVLQVSGRLDLAQGLIQQYQNSLTQLAKA